MKRYFSAAALAFLMVSCLTPGSSDDFSLVEHGADVGSLLGAPNFRTEASARALQRLLSESVDPEAALVELCERGTSGSHYYALIGLLQVNSGLYGKALGEFAERRTGMLVEYVVLDRYRGEIETVRRVLRDVDDIDLLISVEVALPMPGGSEITMISEPDGLP